MSDYRRVDNLEVKVTDKRDCDICELWHRKALAEYDGKMSNGVWANMCQPCFNMHGVGLGTGKGQKLIYEVSSEL